MRPAYEERATVNDTKRRTAACKIPRAAYLEILLRAFIICKDGNIGACSQRAYDFNGRKVIATDLV